MNSFEFCILQNKIINPRVFIVEAFQHLFKKKNAAIMQHLECDTKKEHFRKFLFKGRIILKQPPVRDTMESCKNSSRFFPYRKGANGKCHLSFHKTRTGSDLRTNLQNWLTLCLREPQPPQYCLTRTLTEERNSPWRGPRSDSDWLVNRHLYRVD